MGLKRRDFLKLMPLGAFVPGQLQSAELESQDSSQIEQLYNQAIVIDALISARDWGEDWLKAVEQSGYTGILTSLSSGNLTSALRALATWDTRIQENPDKLLRAVSAADFERAKRDGKLAMMFGFQNATMIGNDIDNLENLYENGTRWIQLTYNERNLLGYGCTERTNAGLSDFGVAAVARMNQLGIIVDLSHCGRQTTMDGIQFSNPGPCFNHTMCEALYPDHPRAKTDEQIRAMADKGGVMGVIALGYMIGPDPGGETTIETHADHVDHAVQVAGIDHVGLSSDFAIRGISRGVTRESWYVPRLTSFKPSYQVRWPPWIPELESPERYKTVAQVLDRRGYRSGDIEKILGLNWLRFYREVLKPD